MPVCSIFRLNELSPIQLESQDEETTPIEWSEKVCGKELIGEGKATAEFQFPEQGDFTGEGSIRVFNGAPKEGHPVLNLYVFGNIPAPTALVISGVIQKAQGKFGTHAIFQIPTIAEGKGRLTGFEAKIGKTWSFEGHRQSVLRADCPTGNLRPWRI